MVAIYGAGAFAPGRVIGLGYNLEHNGRTYAFPWLYVVSVVGDLVSGVLFDNGHRADNAHPSFYGATRADIVARHGREESVCSHTLPTVAWWPEAVAAFLATPDTFPDVTLPAHAPAPVPPLTGDTIPREHVVARLTRASEIASQYADDNSLCGEFERCLEAIGLEDLGLRSVRVRERAYEVSYDRETECDTCGHETTERHTTTVYIEAHDDDDAWEVLLNGDYLPDWDGDSDAVEMSRV